LYIVYGGGRTNIGRTTINLPLAVIPISLTSDTHDVGDASIVVSATTNYAVGSFQIETAYNNQYFTAGFHYIALCT
jgi:hypothetical protein